MAFVHTKYNQTSLLSPGDKLSDEQLVEEAKLLSFERSIKRVNRRNFLSGLGVAGLAAGAATMVGCSDSGAYVAPVTTTTAPPSVFDVLNFALNLEYLEASFYLYITTGSGLSAADMGTGAGTVTGGAKLTFVNQTVANVANQLAKDELEHVEFLRKTIAASGGTAVSMPNLNLAAMGTPTTDAQFLMLSRQLETVGVSAYAGGAQYLVSNTAALTYAAQILDTEAQHEGFLRELCITMNVASPAVDGFDNPPTSAASGIFNTDPTTGLNPVRTPSQVLQIVYAAAGKTGVSSGGFFPAGLNGTLKTT